MTKIKDRLEKNILILQTLKGQNDCGWYEIWQSEILSAEWEQFSIKKLKKSSSQRTKTVNVLASKDKKKLLNFLERNKVVIHILCCSLLSVIITSSVTKSRLNTQSYYIINHRYQINTSQFLLTVKITDKAEIDW